MKSLGFDTLTTLKVGIFFAAQILISDGGVTADATFWRECTNLWVWFSKCGCGLNFHTHFVRENLLFEPPLGNPVSATDVRGALTYIV